MKYFLRMIEFRQRLIKILIENKLLEISDFCIIYYYVQQIPTHYTAYRNSIEKLICKLV